MTGCPVRLALEVSRSKGDRPKPWLRPHVATPKNSALADARFSPRSALAPFRAGKCISSITSPTGTYFPDQRSWAARSAVETESISSSVAM